MNSWVAKVGASGVITMALLCAVSAQGHVAPASVQDSVSREKVNISTTTLKYVGAFVRAFDAHHLALNPRSGISVPSAWLFSKDGVLLLEGRVIFQPGGKKYDIIVNDVKSPSGKPSWRVFSEILEGAAGLKKQINLGSATLVLAAGPQNRCPPCQSFEKAVYSAAAKRNTPIRTIKLTVSD